MLNYSFKYTKISSVLAEDGHSLSEGLPVNLTFQLHHFILI